MNYQGVERAWMDFKSKATEEVVDLSMECHILTLKEYMDVQIEGERATARLRSIDVFTEKEQWVYIGLPVWAANALREATFCLKINKKLYIPTPYVIQRNLRDVFGLSGIAVSGNTNRMVRDKFLASLFKEKGIVKIISKEKQGVYILEMIKSSSQKEGLHAAQLAELFEKYKTDFEVESDPQNPDIFCYTAYFPELEKDGFIYGIRAEDSIIGRSGIIFYILAKELKSGAVFYLDSRTRGHRSTDSIAKFFAEVEAALLKSTKKRISMDVSKEEVLKRGYSSLKSKKREQLRTILNNNLDTPLLSAYHAIETLFPKKDYTDAFYDAGKAKFLLALGGLLTGADSVC